MAEAFKEVAEETTKVSRQVKCIGQRVKRHSTFPSPEDQRKSFKAQMTMEVGAVATFSKKAKRQRE